MMMMMNGGRSCRFPFTASQWEELEHQALVFKYIVSGIPIPQDLLFTIRTSLDSSLSSRFLLHQPHHIGLNGFHMGLGRKVDPEPGRCRRTDGKKWRCSKEAYPESKYCERHMHRGRNRSRKPVEILSQTPTKPAAAAAPLPINNCTSITKNESHFLYPPHFSSNNSSRPPGIAFSNQENPVGFFLESSIAYSPSPGKVHRNSYGPGKTDEHACFSSEPNSNSNSSSGTTRGISDNSCLNIDSSWQQLTMGSTYSSGLENRQQQILTRQLNNHENHYYNTDMLLNPDQKDHDDQPKKVMHHFLDELPLKHKDSWPNPDENLSSHRTTHLSISSPPNSLHDFFMTQKW
ncbi:Growth-regulating factor 3 [Sesamum alatum]|uniref:Growth-regulating factor n=1 Tax=Sesamum alatum TaxID=300844 RepID=A0AAE1YN31_9LAMI|nr:Growth-regulating factor 3 [Sesamum alatum]